MTARVLGTVLLKTLGLMWLYAAVAGAVQQIFGPRSVMGAEDFAYGLIATIAFMGIAGTVLLVGGSRVAELLLPESEALRIEATPSQLFSMLAAIVGVYFFVSSVASLIALLYVSIKQPDWNQQPGFEQLWETQRVQLVTNLIEAALGVALVLGRRGLTTLWDRLRSAGVSVPEEETR